VILEDMMVLETVVVFVMLLPWDPVDSGECSDNVGLSAWCWNGGNMAGGNIGGIPNGEAKGNENIGGAENMDDAAAAEYGNIADAKPNGS
jgi:hypothetical protein